MELFLYILSLASTFALLLGKGCFPHHTMATEYYVKSTDIPMNASCPHLQCLTLNQYAMDPGQYFKSNTVFKFQPGKHQVNTSVVFNNVRNVSLVNVNGTRETKILSLLSCHCDKPSMCALSLCKAFHISDATGISIKGLSIFVHSRNASTNFVTGLSFENVLGFDLQDCRVSILSRTVPSSVYVSRIVVKFLTVTHSGVHLKDVTKAYISNITVTAFNYSIFLKSATNIFIRKTSIRSAFIGILIWSSSKMRISNVNVNTSYASICAYKSSTLTVKDSLIDLVEMHGILLQYCQNSGINNVDIAHSNYFGISLEKTTNTTVINSVVQSCKLRGITVSESINVHILQMRVYDTQFGIHFFGPVTPSVSITIYKVTVMHSRQGIVLFNIASSNISCTSVEHSEIGVYVTLGSDITFHNVNVSHCDSGFFLIHCTSAVFKDITAVNCSNCSVCMDQDQNITLHHLKLDSLNNHGNESPKIGVLVARSSDIIMAESTFGNFKSPSFTTVQVIRQPAVVVFHDCSHIQIQNCTFQNNEVTAMKLIESHINVHGTLNFTGNTAYRGAAMVFIQESSMSLSETSIVTFANNKASDTGGAIYILSSSLPAYNSGGLQQYILKRGDILDLFIFSNCFLRLTGRARAARKQLIFRNNSADLGGDALYGGSLESACEDPSSENSCGRCLSDFRNASLIEPDTLSKITSIHLEYVSVKMVDHPTVWLYTTPITLLFILDRL